MAHVLPTLLNLFQPPYGWILALVLIMPYWVLFFSVLLYRLRQGDGAWSLASERSGTERELSLYAGALTATWLLITAFKVYQQYFATHPIANSRLGLFDFSLGLFSLASWLGLIILGMQRRVSRSEASSGRIEQL